MHTACICQVQNSCVLVHARSPVNYKHFTIEQGDSYCEVTICLVAKFNSSEDLTITVQAVSILGLTFRHCHKRFVE